MKRKIMRLLAPLMMALLLATNSSGLAVAEEQQAEPGKAQYTVMYYMNGSDLESKPDGEGGSATSDLQEMMAVGSNENLHIVVETLATKHWYTPEISSERNQRWYIENGAMTLVNDDLGLRRLDDPANLTDFITWSMENYPAEKYILIFWNHGAGSVDGFGQDEHHDDATLSLAGIRQGIADALEGTGQTLELVGFDTCLMATVEVATQVAPFAHYMVASEELEPGHGWNHTNYLQAIAENPEVTGDKLGPIIADGFKEQAESEGTDQKVTLSVTDLSKVDDVVTALEELVTAMGTDIVSAEPARINSIAKARSKAESYGNGHGDASDMVDLGDLARQAAATYGTEAEALLEAVDAAVLYKIGSVGKPDGTGLSVYFPLRDKEGLERKLETYAENTPFSETYKEFVNLFGQVLASDSVAPAFAASAPEEDEGEDGSSRSRSVKVSPDAIDEIAEIYSVVAEFDEESSRLIFLGMDNDVEFDEETGEILDSFTGAIVTLNGEYVSLFYTGEGEDFYEYSIPVKLNGKELDLLVLYNFKTDKAEIIGGWEGFDPESHMASKKLIKIKDGDKIVPQFFYYDTNTEQDGLVDGTEFTVKGGLKLGVTDLPEGEYEYGFLIQDYFGNEAFSEFVTVAWAPEEPADEEPAVEEPKEPTAPAAPTGAIKVLLDGTELVFDVAPELRGGRVMVPFRTIFEALGAQVSWDGKDTVTAKRGDLTVGLQIESQTAYRNDEAVTLDQAPVLSNGRTLVPLRFVSEAMGARVSYDGGSMTVTITTR